MLSCTRNLRPGNEGTVNLDCIFIFILCASSCRHLNLPRFVTGVMDTQTSAPPVTKVLVLPGAGEYPRKGDFVTVHCTGFGKDKDLASKFWSTRDDGEEQFKFQLSGGDVIEGWEIALLTMRVGERAEFVIRSDFAYGEDGFSDFGILPNSPLKFDLELLRIDPISKSSRGAQNTSGVGSSAANAVNRFQPSVPLEGTFTQRLVPGKVAVRYKPPAIGLQYSLSKNLAASAAVSESAAPEDGEPGKQQVLVLPLNLSKSVDAPGVTKALLRGDFGCATFFAALKPEQIQRVVAVLLRNLQ